MQYLFLGHNGRVIIINGSQVNLTNKAVPCCFIFIFIFFFGEILLDYRRACMLHHNPELLDSWYKIMVQFPAEVLKNITAFILCRFLRYVKRAVDTPVLFFLMLRGVKENLEQPLLPLIQSKLFLWHFKMQYEIHCQRELCMNLWFKCTTYLDEYLRTKNLTSWK